MKQLVFASHNEGKVKELRSLLKDFPIEVLSLHDIGFHDEIIRPLAKPSIDKLIVI